MSILAFVVVLALIGFALWAVPMDPTIKRTIVIVVVICAILAVLYATGLLSRASEVRIPKL